MSRIVLAVVAVSVAVDVGCAEPFYDDDIGVEGVPVDVGALAGVFGVKGVAVDQADTVLGKVDTGGMTFYLSRREFNAETRVYDETLEPCVVINFETAGLSTENSTDGIASIPAISATLTVDHATGAYTRSTFFEYWAIRGLDDDAPLPSDVDDDVYYDADGDDHPGITVFTSGLVNGEVYVAQRKTVTTGGVVQGEDLSFGLLQAKKEGLVLGASNDLLLTEAARVPHPDPKESWWADVRLDDDASCDDVSAAIDDEVIPRRRPF